MTLSNIIQPQINAAPKSKKKTNIWNNCKILEIRPIYQNTDAKNYISQYERWFWAMIATFRLNFIAVFCTGAKFNQKESSGKKFQILVMGRKTISEKTSL